MRVKIGSRASFFHGAAETHIYENDNLITEIQIPSDVIDVQNYVLNNAIDLQTITLHEGIKSIAYSAFAGCSSLELGDVNLPNLESIGNLAFSKLKSIDDINLPSLISINDAAFHSSGIKKVSNLGSITSLPGGQWSQNGIFRNCVNLISVVLPDTLETITSSSGYSNCFNGCTSLKTININHIKEIGR